MRYYLATAVQKSFHLWLALQFSHEQKSRTIFWPNSWKTGKRELWGGAPLRALHFYLGGDPRRGWNTSEEAYTGLLPAPMHLTNPGDVLSLRKPKVEGEQCWLSQTPFCNKKDIAALGLSSVKQLNLLADEPNCYLNSPSKFRIKEHHVQALWIFLTDLHRKQWVSE